MASGTDPPSHAHDHTHLRRPRPPDERDHPLPDGGTRTVAYTYFSNGTRKTVTDPAGSVTQYAYDGQNRLKTATTAPPAAQDHHLHLRARRSAEDGQLPERRHRHPRLRQGRPPAQPRQREDATPISLTRTPASIRPAACVYVRPERQPPEPGREQRRSDRDDDLHLRRPRPPRLGHLPDRHDLPERPSGKLRLRRRRQPAPRDRAGPPRRSLRTSKGSLTTRTASPRSRTSSRPRTPRPSPGTRTATSSPRRQRPHHRVPLRHPRQAGRDRPGRRDLGRFQYDFQGRRTQKIGEEGLSSTSTTRRPS